MLVPRADYIILLCLVTAVLERRRDFNEAPVAGHVEQRRVANDLGLCVVGGDAVRSKLPRSSRRNSLRVCLVAFILFLRLYFFRVSIHMIGILKLG